MKWTIELSSGAEKNLDRLDRNIAKRILSFLHDRVAKLENPKSIGEALKGKIFKNLWRYRVGDYRIISMIEDDNLKVIVVKIGHRREVYGESAIAADQ